MTPQWGQPVRARCTATGRYIGRYGGEEWVLYVSAQDNDLSLDHLGEAEPWADSPLPTLRECAAAGVGLSTGLTAAFSVPDRGHARPLLTPAPERKRAFAEHTRQAAKARGRHGQEWTNAELQIALDPNLTTEEAAISIGRSYYAVATQRRDHPGWDRP